MSSILFLVLPFRGSLGLSGLVPLNIGAMLSSLPRVRTPLASPFRCMSVPHGRNFLFLVCGSAMSESDFWGLLKKYSSRTFKTEFVLSRCWQMQQWHYNLCLREFRMLFQQILNVSRRNLSLERHRMICGHPLCYDSYEHQANRIDLRTSQLNSSTLASDRILAKLSAELFREY